MQEWSEYMQSRGVSPEEQEKAGNYTLETARGARDVIVESLEGTATDHFGALSVRRSWVLCTVVCSAESCTALVVDAALALNVGGAVWDSCKV